MEQGQRVSDFPFLELETPGVFIRNFAAVAAREGKLTWGGLGEEGGHPRERGDLSVPQTGAGCNWAS